MTETSPIPSCLSHLTQRDAAVTARALEEAVRIAEYGCLVDAPTHAEAYICQRVADAIRALIPTPSSEEAT